MASELTMAGSGAAGLAQQVLVGAKQARPSSGAKASSSPHWRLRNHRRRDRDFALAHGGQPPILHQGAVRAGMARALDAGPNTGSAWIAGQRAD
jgi:hypothetical protein